MHTALYRFYNAEGRLLYVGITSVGPSRWKQHAIEKGWWTEVASITIEHFDTRAEATLAERSAIQAEHPMHNVIHSTQRPTAATPAVIRSHGMGTMSQRQDGRRRYLNWWASRSRNRYGSFADAWIGYGRLQLHLSLVPGEGWRYRVSVWCFEVEVRW